MFEFIKKLLYNIYVNEKSLMNNLTKKKNFDIIYM